MENIHISTYIIHQKKSDDHLMHIRNEFAGKDEFDIVTGNTVDVPVASVSLWNGIVQAVSIAHEQDEDVIVVCKDDHCFTTDYNRKEFFDILVKAHCLSTDILVGGILGGFSNIVVVDKQLLWLDNFFGTQFMVIYNKFFLEILGATFAENDDVDKKLSRLSANKLLMYPMISESRGLEIKNVGSVHSTTESEGHTLFDISRTKLDRLYRKHFLLKGQR